MGPPFLMFWVSFSKMDGGGWVRGTQHPVTDQGVWQMGKEKQGSFPKNWVPRAHHSGVGLRDNGVL